LAASGDGGYGSIDGFVDKLQHMQSGRALGAAVCADALVCQYEVAPVKFAKLRRVARVLYHNIAASTQRAQVTPERPSRTGER
jgi:hypothetical protein